MAGQLPCTADFRLVSSSQLGIRLAHDIDTEAGFTAKHPAIFLFVDESHLRSGAFGIGALRKFSHQQENGTSGHGLSRAEQLSGLGGGEASLHLLL